ncbi:MAG: hypothetical protein H6765_09985 [Candidatus Peribacteria bacterium]|nr:MAG: hypothetical protein H6765_09985 [Candidatus Peribacteria bacterium]
MNTLNLVNYVRHGMLFNNLSQYELFDAIIYETYDNPHIPVPQQVVFKTLF